MSHTDDSAGGLTPVVSVILTGLEDGPTPGLAASIRSVLEQTLPSCEILVPARVASALEQDEPRLVIVPETSGEWSDFAAGARRARGRYLLPLRPGDVLPTWAIGRYLEHLSGSAPGVLYGDEDRIDHGGKRSDPWLKPLWNPEMFLAQDYLTGACLLEANLARAAAAADPLWPASTPYSLTLAACSITNRPIVHVPSIQCHRTLLTIKREQRTEVVSRHLAAHNACVKPGPFDTLRVHWPLPSEPPLVSILIPTRDKMQILRDCITSLALTDYPNYEVIVIDNQSREPECLAYLAQLETTPGIRVMPWDKEYNYSEINNFAAGHAAGRYLCLLNNDTEIIQAGWLSEMMRYAVRPEVGAVGAMLLFGDRTIQHAGVVIGLGGAAGHAHRHLALDDAGYFAQAHVPRFVSAVTAACLVVERSKFMAVGGFDSAAFPVAYNDVDFCLKLEKAGWKNVYAPQAVVVHHESKSRGSDFSAANLARYQRELSNLQERWHTTTYVDPLHHPQLDRSSETYFLNLKA